MVSPKQANPEIEQRCLSTLFFGPEEANAAVRDGLTQAAFQDPKHRAIYRAILQSAAEDRSTDVITVWRRLTGMGGDLQPILVTELAAIEGLEATSARRSKFVSDVVGLWRQRKLIDALNAATEAASTPATHWADVWEATEPHLRAAQHAGQHSSDRTLADMARVAADRFVNGDKRAVVGTGIDKWDQGASPIRAGELVVIAARPGAGKTAIALQMASHSARNYAPATAFFSLEMSGEELVTRMAISQAGPAGIHDYKRRGPAAEEIGRLRSLFVYEGSAAGTITQIEARCRLLAASPVGIRAVFVDYLQLIAPPPETKRDNRERQVAELSRRFKLLAGEIKCPIVLLAQVNRESEKEQRRPRMSDLRESGAIEQDADRIWFLYQPEGDNSRTDEAAGEIRVALYQVKCRNGKPGVQTILNFNRPLFTFTST